MSLRSLLRCRHKGGQILVLRLSGTYDRGMTEAIAFDTHRFVKRLTESGFTERQAETLADEQVALLNANLATKTDIEVLRQETKAGIDALRQETKAGIEALRQETKAGIESLRQETKAEIARIEAGVEALRQETKADIARVEAAVETLRQETKADIARVEAGVEILRQETKAAIEGMKADLLKWLFGALIAQGGLIVALVKLL